MALTESTMMPLGTKAIDFTLPDPSTGTNVALSDLDGENGLVVMFICNHCPYVIHINPELVRIANEYSKKGISFVAISSNDVENYPDDSPDYMRMVSMVLQFPFPYLYDESQKVAKDYDAACTPDLYVFDGDRNLYYRGRLDGSRPKNDEPLSGKDLRGALNGLLTGDKAPEKQYPSAGCNIKWKK